MDRGILQSKSLQRAQSLLALHREASLCHGGTEQKEKGQAVGTGSRGDLVASSVTQGLSVGELALSPGISVTCTDCSAWPHSSDELGVTLCHCPCSKARGVGSSGLPCEQNCRAWKGPRDHLHPKH